MLRKAMTMIVLATAVSLGGTALSTAALARGGGFGGGHFGGGHFGGGYGGHMSGRFGGFHGGHEHGGLRHVSAATAIRRIIVDIPTASTMRTASRTNETPQPAISSAGMPTPFIRLVTTAAPRPIQARSRAPGTSLGPSV